jgi:hypothetical protein
MSEVQGHEPFDERDLEELLRTYATTPRPAGAFARRLERRLLAKQAQSASPVVGAEDGFLAALAGWWRRGTRPLQVVTSALGTVALLILLLFAAGLFVSWILGIQQIAGGEATPDAAAIPGAGSNGSGDPIADPRLPSPTPFGDQSPTPFAESSATPLRPSPTPPRAADFPHHQQAILVAPSDDLHVPQSEFARLGIDIVPTMGDLRARMRGEAVEIVYFHPAVFRDLPSDALRDLYEAGILIVVLQVPVSEISAKLPVFEDYDDLAPDTFADETLFVAAAFQLQDAYYPSGSARWAWREFYPADRLWMIVDEAERQWRQIDAAQTDRPPAPTKLTPTVTVTPFNGTAVDIWTPTPPPPPTVTSTPFPGSSPTPPSEPYP